jgi:hypothetical protein
MMRDRIVTPPRRVALVIRSFSCRLDAQQQVINQDGIQVLLLRANNLFFRAKTLPPQFLTSRARLTRAYFLPLLSRV